MSVIPISKLAPTEFTFKNLHAYTYSTPPKIDVFVATWLYPASLMITSAAAKYLLKHAHDNDQAAGRVSMAYCGSLAINYFFCFIMVNLHVSSFSIYIRV